MEADGTKYRKCIAWRQIAGKGHACKEMCKEEQQQKCHKQQLEDSREGIKK